MGMLSNKDPRGFLEPIAPFVDRLISAPISNHEYHAPQELADVAASLGIAASTETDIAAALRDLAASGATRILIAGSLYLAGEALAANDELPD